MAIELQDPQSIKLSGSTLQALEQVSDAMQQINHKRPFNNAVADRLRETLLPDRIAASLNMEGIGLIGDRPRYSGLIGDRPRYSLNIKNRLTSG